MNIFTYGSGATRVNFTCDGEIMITNSFTFFAIGDFGSPTEGVKKTAHAMAAWSNKSSIPRLDFIIALGDNFYPYGVESVEDPKFKSDWQDIFLIYDSLRVPWKICLGNHDYYGNWNAQVEFTNHKSNLNGLWQCPSFNYSFVHPISSDDVEENTDHNNVIEFFCIDTNGVQESVRKRDPQAEEKLLQNIADLSRKIESSSARWKIVYGHHPMYTKGRWHGFLGRRLRGSTYINAKKEEVKGFGMESFLVRGRVDAYISGHEHRFQHHFANGLHNFVSGAGGYDNRFYGGENLTQEIDWVDKDENDGFLAVEVSQSKLVFRFISNKDNSVIKEVEVVKD